MNFGDPNSMNDILSRVLRYGVVVSATILVFGTILLLVSYSSVDASEFLTYLPQQIPHNSFTVNPSALFEGVAALNPFAVIELGVIALLATPVTRVFFSILLFAAERDATYVKITIVVLLLLLFSILVTPLIPAFNA